jgi:glycosyltransferase involved in cell wall biosynthesis
MRIAIYHDLPSGGAKRALYEWTRHLSQKHSIDVYTTNTADHEFCDIRPFSKNYNISYFSPRKLYESPFGRLNQYQRWMDLNDLKQVGRDVAEKINTGGYDVLFAHPSIYTTIPLVLIFTTIPSVYYLHEPFGPGITPHHVKGVNILRPVWKDMLDNNDPLIKLYNHRLENLRKQSIENAHLLLSNSKFTCEKTKSNYGRNSTVCHVGVDVHGFYKMPLVEEDFVLSVGELSPRKGFDFLVECLGQIPSQYRPALKLACNTIHAHEQAYVESLAREKGVNLEILYNLNVDQLRLLYNKAKLCVYAPIMEPFGLVPLEAMACGKAVVGVKEGGILESIVHEYTGLLIERNIEKFSNAIMELLKNPGWRNKMGEQGRQYILKNWSWEKSVVELEKHLHSVTQPTLKN